MTKIVLRLISILILSTMILSLTAACKNNDGTNGDDKQKEDSRGNEFIYNLDEFIYNPDEFVYVPELAKIPGDVEDVMSFVYSNGRVYLASREILDSKYYITIGSLFSMAPDGTDLTRLTGYTPEKPPGDDIWGNIDIQRMSIDNDGNVWIVETTTFSRFNLPPGIDDDDDEKYNHIEDIISDFKLLKLDNTGVELLSIDLSSIRGRDEYFSFESFEIDNEGNIFMLNRTNTNSIRIYILNSDGELLFRINSPDNISSTLLKMADGSVAYAGGTFNPVHEYIFRTIDIETGTLHEEGIKLTAPAGTYHMISPGGEYFDLLINNGSSLYGYILETGEAVELLNWIDSNQIGGDLRNIRLLSDRRIMFMEREFNSERGKFDFRLTILTKTLLSDMPENIVLTLATAYPNQLLESAVVEFNRQNQKYTIKVIDYSQWGTMDGYFNLAVDIIAGNVPDIIDIAGLPFEQFVNIGLLEDLYHFIDSDRELDRSSFVQSALRAAEVDGGLYQLFPGFIIHTIAGNPSVLGPEPGWNIEEFIGVIEANPQATTPIGKKDGISEFISTLIYSNLSEYIDRSTGTAYFDRGDFAKLLEYAAALETRSAFGDSSIDYTGVILSGEQIMEVMYGFYRTDLFQIYKAMFGGDLVFKGFPVENRNGNIMGFMSSRLAITTTCKNKEGAWEFVRMFLTQEWQEENLLFNDFVVLLPLNKAVFDEMIYRKMNIINEGTSGWNGFTIKVVSITQEEADQIIALVDSLSGFDNRDLDLINIVKEGVDDFANGRNNAQDTARIIQSRVSIYLAEQS